MQKLTPACQQQGVILYSGDRQFDVKDLRVLNPLINRKELQKFLF